MLDLRCPALRLVHDRLAAPEQEGTAQVEAVLVAGIAGVQERLGEEPPDPGALLEALVLPVLRLRRAVGARVLQPVEDRRGAVGGHEFGVVVRAPVEASLADPAPDAEVAGIWLAGASRRGRRREVRRLARIGE